MDLAWFPAEGSGGDSRRRCRAGVPPEAGVRLPRHQGAALHVRGVIGFDKDVYIEVPNVSLSSFTDTRGSSTERRLSLFVQSSLRIFCGAGWHGAYKKKRQLHTALTASSTNVLDILSRQQHRHAPSSRHQRGHTQTRGGEWCFIAPPPTPSRRR